MLNPLSCYDKFLCFQLDADSPGVQSTSSYQSASTEEEVLIKTHFQIACLLTIMLDPQAEEHCSPGGGGHPLPGASGHLPSWDSRRRRGQPVLKKLLRCRLHTSPKTLSDSCLSVSSLSSSLSTTWKQTFFNRFSLHIRTGNLFQTFSCGFEYSNEESGALFLPQTSQTLKP